MPMHTKAEVEEYERRSAAELDDLCRPMMEAIHDGLRNAIAACDGVMASLDLLKSALAGAGGAPTDACGAVDVIRSAVRRGEFDLTVRSRADEPPQTHRLNFLTDGKPFAMGPEREMALCRDIELGFGIMIAHERFAFHDVLAVGSPLAALNGVEKRPAAEAVALAADAKAFIERTASALQEALPRAVFRGVTVIPQQPNERDLLCRNQDGRITGITRGAWLRP